MQKFIITIICPIFCAENIDTFINFFAQNSLFCGLAVKASTCETRVHEFKSNFYSLCFERASNTRPLHSQTDVLSARPRGSVKSGHKKYLTKLIFSAQKIVYIAVIRVNFCFVNTVISQLLCELEGNVSTDPASKGHV